MHWLLIIDFHGYCIIDGYIKCSSFLSGIAARYRVYSSSSDDDLYWGIERQHKKLKKEKKRDLVTVYLKVEVKKEEQLV